MNTPRALQALLTGAIDYAGVFPPASLDLTASVANYAAYRRSDQAWMLGRLVLPAARLAEFSEAAASALPRGGAAPAWPVCAVAGAGAAQDLSAIDMFNRRHDGRGVAGRACVELVEVKVSAARDVRALDEVLPRGTRMVCEVVSGGALAATLQVVRDFDGIAKIRTGGQGPDAVPSSEAVADFLLACHVARVPFKATAGLHHAVSGDYTLSGDAEAPRARLHGFLNVLLASVMVNAAPRTADARLRGEVVRLLDDVDVAAFTVSDDAVRWRDATFSESAIAACRESFGLSFGSCSFDEPLADLRAMQLAV